MYRYSNGQISLSDFHQPMGMQLREDNRWVKKAQIIPWDKIEAKYADLFPSGTGNVAKPLQLALGACLIQREYGYSDEEMEAIKTFFDFFYDDTRYSDWVIMEDFLPATSTGGEILAAADESMAAWVDIVGSSNFYPTAKAEWADVKQGVINVEQQALLGGNVQELLDALQSEIAG